MALDITQFELVWGDEFTDLSLSDNPTRGTARWYTQQMWGGGFGNAAFMGANSGVFNLVQQGGESALEIKMRKNASGGLEGGIISNVFPDGTSEANQTSREGYYEAMLWLPNPIAGIWPGFWAISKERLKTADRDHVIELDVMEHYGAPMPDRFTSSVHDWDWAGTTLQGHNQIFSRKVAGSNTLNTGWHTYGIEIGADGSLTYYFDRMPYYFVAGDASNNGNLGSNFNNMMPAPFGWMIDFAAGAGWPIDPNLGGSLPASLYVSYFRIYKRIAGSAGDTSGGGSGGSGNPPPPPPPSPPPPPPPPANDPPTLSVSDATVSEAGPSLVFNVTLSAAQTGIVNVDYTTADGTATAGADYTAVSGTLSFAPGETSKAITVDVLEDTLVEGSETVTLTLSNAIMVSDLSITDASAVGTITDNDVPPPPPSVITGTNADETLTGTANADTIYGLGGRDTISGGGGDDVIVGGPGIDTLYGGPGNNIFKYDADAEGWTDVIKDWHAGDKIDLSSLHGTNPPFTFIGNTAFTGTGQVRVYNSTYLGVTYTQIEVNIQGSLAADLSISIKNGPTLTADDFIL